MVSTRASIVGLALVASAMTAWGQARPEKPSAPATPPVKSPARSGSPKVDLRPKFTKGQEVRYSIKLDSRDTGSESGKQSSDQEFVILLRCTDTDPESGASLDLVYERVRMKVNNGLMNIDFDSSKPAKDEDPIDAALRSLVGLTLPVKMDPDGNITSVGGGLGELAGAMGGEFSGADVVKNIFGPITTDKKSPGKAAVGETWTTEDTMGGGMGQMRITMNHTLASHSGGKAIINTSGKVTMEPSNAGGGKAPQVRISDSTITGKTTWDTELGMLRDMDSRQKFTVQTRQGGGPASTTTQEMNVQVKRINK